MFNHKVVMLKITKNISLEQFESVIIKSSIFSEEEYENRKNSNSEKLNDYDNRKNAIIKEKILKY